MSTPSRSDVSLCCLPLWAEMGPERRAVIKRAQPVIAIHGIWQRGHPQ
jgi:hypothetical protein